MTQHVPAYCGAVVDLTSGNYHQQTTWRRERDSNPRSPLGLSGFQDRLFQPLTHPSADARASLIIKYRSLGSEPHRHHPARLSARRPGAPTPNIFLRMIRYMLASSDYGQASPAQANTSPIACLANPGGLLPAQPWHGQTACRPRCLRRFLAQRDLHLWCGSASYPRDSRRRTDLPERL